MYSRILLGLTGSLFLAYGSGLCLALPAQGQSKPLPPAEAPKHMTLPEGFHATLFAGEPDVVQPIAFTFDDRGRLWVVECLSYPNWEKDWRKGGKDRILIFEVPIGGPGGSGFLMIRSADKEGHADHNPPIRQASRLSHSWFAG